MITDYSINSNVLISIIKDASGRNICDLKIIDFGCYEGFYSIELAKLGADVLGIEGRQINVDKANAEYQAPNLVFVKDDVKNFIAPGESCVDIALVAGLLYHLDFESSMVLLKNICITSRILILETNIAGCLPPEYHHLKPEEHIHDGITYDGVCYPEPIKGLNEQQIENRRSSAISNETSFWFTEKSLVEMLKYVGYNSILKVLEPKPVKVHYRHTYVAMR